MGDVEKAAPVEEHEVILICCRLWLLMAFLVQHKLNPHSRKYFSPFGTYFKDESNDDEEGEVASSRPGRTTTSLLQVKEKIRGSRFESAV